MKCYEVNYVKILCNVYLYISIISFRRAHFKITLGLCLFILKILKKPRNKHCVYYLTIKFGLPSKLKKKKNSLLTHNQSITWHGTTKRLYSTIISVNKQFIHNEFY